MSGTNKKKLDKRKLWYTKIIYQKKMDENRRCHMGKIGEDKESKGAKSYKDYMAEDITMTEASLRYGNASLVSWYIKKNKLHKKKLDKTVTD
ncbi:MAG: hypothetical protein ACRCZ9_12095 [Fusobacteriaceae bacterium]